LDNNNIVDENINEEKKLRGDTIGSIFSGALHSKALVGVYHLLIGGDKCPACDS